MVKTWIAGAAMLAAFVGGIFLGRTPSTKPASSHPGQLAAVRAAPPQPAVAPIPSPSARPLLAPLRARLEQDETRLAAIDQALRNLDSDRDEQRLAELGEQIQSQRGLLQALEMEAQTQPSTQSQARN